MEEKQQETIDDITNELRNGCQHKNICSYLEALADRIEAAHTHDVVKAMDELMGN